MDNLTIIQKFRALIASLRRKGDEPRPKYVHLAPTDNADETGIYSEALDYATNEPNVSNIAVTGPYGSGKSSIIKTFLKTYKRPALQISLAAFLPEVDGSSATGEGPFPRKGSVNTQEIERSILQQMLYGPDANSLPLSRFKRIQSPTRSSRFISLFIIIGLFACWHLFQESSEIFSGAFFKPFDRSNWFNLTSFALGFLFLWQAFHHIYVKSFGLSLKSISLNDIEITPDDTKEESILSRHLDEIIYFFQSTEYDIVVIEDLDRFDNPEIFVTLREINSLINKNAGVKRTIRFLYALRDDMFVNTDRTKFFEFIIPVIPIINSSNSIDKVIEQGKRLSLLERLDPQFLREVSRYLYDLRLIQNIFNEYAIYAANLDPDGENNLDKNKLLAILIYKNVIPNDFEELHREKGKLANILSRHETYITTVETQYKAKISDLEKIIGNSERQIPSNLEELRKIYAMTLITKIPASHTLIEFNGNQNIPIKSLLSYQDFDQLLEASEIFSRSPQHGPHRVNLGDLQKEVDAERSYQERKEEIESKSDEFRKAASKTIRELRKKISTLRTAKFNEIIRSNAKDTEELFEAFGENKELVRFLVFEGFLDDTYYQYTSLFHKGRLSPNDNKFLIQIRSFNNPEPDFQIDNPKELIAAMRGEDFRQNYTLNVKIINCLLRDPSTYKDEIAKLFELIASNFEECEAFFKTYYATGTEVSNLISRLIETWEGFVPAAIASPENLSHVTQIIAHLPAPTLEKLPVRYREITDFISSNLPSILGLRIDFEPERLKLLEIEVEDLATIEDYPGIARVLFEEGLYQLTIANVEFIFRAMLGKSDPEGLRTQNYTTVRNSKDTALISRIERDFGSYLQNVLLRLEENSQESVPAILGVIERAEIDLDDIRAFLQKQQAVIPSLDKVPLRLHALLFQIAKVEASWENCLLFLASENFDADSLTAYLGINETLTTLSRQDIPSNDEAYPLREFLIENDTLQDDAYRTYVRGLPRHFTKFPEQLGTSKLQIVIEEGKVTFSAENFSFLEAGSDLQVLFVARNIEQYLGDENTFALDDDFREKLLASGIRDNEKLAIVRSMNLTLLANMPSRASAVGPILDRTGTDMSLLDAGSARAIIVNSQPNSVKISLFNKCQSILGDGDVREILAMLPEPFSEIKTGYNTPRLRKTAENLDLVKWLDSRNIISSWSEGYFSNDIRVNLYRR